MQDIGPSMSLRPNADHLQPYSSYATANGTTYPPIASTSSISLRLNEEMQEDSEKAIGKQQKRGWVHRELNTAFGPLNVKMFLKKKYIKWYLILLLILVLVALMTIYHSQIVGWMEPIATKIKDIPAGWLIWVGTLFIISFPPLFGHEIVAILCGVIYGLWMGFAVVALGTLLGELGTYFAFKWCCRARAEKYEKNDINYACMTRVIQEGGFKIVFLARLSAIPGHLTTAVFSTCGLNFWSFIIATVLTLPKQLQVVYLGVVFNDVNKSTKSKIISDSVLALSFLITIGAALYIYKQMSKWRPVVLEERALKEENTFLAGNESELDWSHSRKRPNERTYVQVDEQLSPPKRAHSPAYVSQNNSSASLQDYAQTSPVSLKTSQTSPSHPYAYVRAEYPRSAIEYAKPNQISPFTSPYTNPQVLISAPPRIERDPYHRQPQEWIGQPEPWVADRRSPAHSPRTFEDEQMFGSSSRYIVP